MRVSICQEKQRLDREEQVRQMEEQAKILQQEHEQIKGPESTQQVRVELGQLPPLIQV